MSTDTFDAALPQSRRLSPWWSAIAYLLLAAIVAEAAFAGAMLSGLAWARPAHAATAGLLTASALAASLVALGALRRAPNGLRFGLMLLVLAAGLLAQAALGALTMKGANLLWVHVPLGVVLAGVAAQAAALARRLS